MKQMKDMNNKVIKTGALAPALALGLIGSEAFAHGTISGSGRSSENTVCEFAQNEAIQAAQNWCANLPSDFPAVTWWGVVHREVSACSSRRSGRTTLAGNPEYYYHAVWSVTCGPHGNYDHIESYHDPYDGVGPDHSH